jgi:hypothetical protein
MTRALLTTAYAPFPAATGTLEAEIAKATIRGRINLQVFIFNF